jgi:hypothetical protein
MVVCVVTVRDVQPEIRPEVTEKVWESFENPPAPRFLAWQAADDADLKGKIVSASRQNQHASRARFPDITSTRPAALILQQVFQSVGRRAADPRTAAVLIGHN